MKKNLVIDENTVENDSLYKKVNDIKKEKEIEKQNDIIRRRKSIIISFFFTLVIIGFINFLSSVSRFDNAVLYAKGIKQFIILAVSIIIFIMTILSGNTIYKIVSKPRFRFFVLMSALLIFGAIAIIPNNNLFPTINGGKGWVHIGAISIQVPEITFYYSFSSYICQRERR